MAQITITQADGDVIITGSALSADTDFQITDGSCRMTTETFSAENEGFSFSAVRMDSWFVASGKTVTVRTDARAVIVYETLA